MQMHMTFATNLTASQLSLFNVTKREIQRAKLN